MGVRERLYPAVAEALGVARLARQAEVSQGPKRESRAVMLGTRERWRVGRDQGARGDVRP